jgi:hypothetical protein
VKKDKKSHETATSYLCESLLIALGFLAEGEELEVLGGLHPAALLLLRLLHLLASQNMKKVNGSQDRSQVFGQKLTVLVVNKYLSWFF